ncbi:hypothetical protein NE237_033055 [Protea cynaroides]|uniref:Uncharacterized protein n=1 Tax=Protea cynaroides TaxID=273540 RepID=A0A9Q0L464_9MAGN|nr:hypothetical protein NE237_033055 [Protea cynaroides]
MDHLLNIGRAYSLFLQEESQCSMHTTTSTLDNSALLSLPARTSYTNAATPTNNSKEQCTNYNLIGHNRSSCYKLGHVVASDSKVASIHDTSTPAFTADQYQRLLLLLGEVPQPAHPNLVGSSSQSANTVLPLPMSDFVVKFVPYSTMKPSPSSSSTSLVNDSPLPDPPRFSSRATYPPTRLCDYCCSHV